MSVSSDPDSSRENRLVRHMRSSSEVEKRGHVPMWDSADPERAPPPLPLNPGSSSPVTKPTASASIQAAAAAIAEKAQENAPSSYTTNPPPSKAPSSPEKSLIKGQYHKRMQSFQNSTTNTNRDFASYLERRSSPDKKDKRTERSNSHDSGKLGDHDADKDKDDDKDKSLALPRPTTPTPSSRESPRPSSRYLSKPILGENTPPSSAMLALQNMQVPVDIPSPSALTGKDSSTNTPTHEEKSSAQGSASLSAQIDSLTRIATSLQKEMAQLSRRSKDNATDLVSLKAATNARDEDIRKGLKDLASSVSSKLLENGSTMTPPKQAPQLRHSADPLMIDNQEHNASPSSRKSNYMLPRIPSPSSFAAAMERELTASPAQISTDGSASIALLEKVMREMATKEGQEKLFQLVEDVKSRPAEKGADSSMSKMLEEILDLVKESSGNRALIRAPVGDNGQPIAPTHESNNLAVGTSPVGPLSRASSMEPEHRGGAGGTSDTQAANRSNEDMLQILKRVRSSVAEGGGLTSEVKALVRELRGEVLGMGREIARKIEQAGADRSSNEEAVLRGPGKEEIAEIVEGGLFDLKRQMDHLIRESRRKSPPPEPAHPPLTNDDVYAVVKHALGEIPPPEQPAPQIVGSGLEKDDILDTVREAWETYKPEIELQNFGLEREEILECLTEGLKDFQPQKNEEESTRSLGVTYEEVLDAVHHSLENWTPPRMEPDISVTREAVMSAVQECLESFEWPVPPPAADGGAGAISRDDVLSAVKEGLLERSGAPLESEFPRGDVYDAVRAGFHEASDTLNNHVGEQVMEQFHGLASEMKTEFKQYSAANGRDTEQVLDAVKDGLEVLRGEIESYVDRAADVTGKDEIIDTVKEGFGFLHADVEKCINQTAQNSKGQPPQTVELLDAMEKEFEHLRQTMSNLLIRNSVASDKDEILDAIRDVSNSQNDREISRGSDPDLENIIKDEFQHLRETLSTAIVKPTGSPADKDEIIAALKEGLDTVLDEHSRRKDGSESVVSNTSELLDAFHDGVDVLRADMEKVLQKPVDSSANDEILNTLKGGISDVKEEIEKLREHQKSADETQTARGRELMLGSESSIGHDIESLKVLVTQLQIKVDAIEVNPPAPEVDPSAVKKEDLLEVLEAIKEIQGVVGQAKTGESEPPPSGTARKEDTDAIETLVRNTKAQLDEFMSEEKEKNEPVMEDRFEKLEALANETKNLFEGFTAHLETEAPTKADVSNVETVMHGIWTAVEELKSNSTPSDEAAADKVGKEDIKNLETLMFEMKSQLEDFVLNDAKALPSKDEINDLTELVTEFRDKMDEENELTAQAFESRKVEHGALGEKIDDAKAFVMEIRDELKSRLGDTDENLVDLKSMIDTLNESSDTFAKAESIKELSDLVSREFERSHGDREAAKMEAEERELGALAKHEEGRASAVAEVVTKMEAKFNEALEKYEHSQEQLVANFSAVEERDKETLEAVTSTKSLADDIRLVIGGIGNSVSEACERMGDDARTFFDRVDQSFEKVNGLHSDMMAHRENINGQFQRTLEATDRLEQQMAGAHPEILAAVKEVIALVGQHYEHSQKTTAELKTDLSAIPPLLPALPDASSTREIPAPQLPDVPPAQEKYDDTHLQDKLDMLIEHVTSASQSTSQMEKLQQIQEQVAATARDVSEMMAAQSKAVSEGQERRANEEREVAEALEKRIAQREKVEGEVVALSNEREQLMRTVESLKDEKEQFTRQNTEMAKELARTETALRIRREEVELMEERAERIERRIVEDVLDHARSMAMHKPGSGSNSSSSDATSNGQRRVPSGASTVTRESVASTAPDGGGGSTVSSMVGMALKRQNPSRSNTTAGSALSTSSSNRNAGRRILSHSHVTGNRKPTDRQTIAPLSGNSQSSGGSFGNLKRSQSVKSNINYGLAGRKASWEPRLSIANKENEVVKEEEEEEETRDHASGDEAPSDAGTERRSSYTGTLESMSYVTGSAISYGSSTHGLVSAEGGSWTGRHDDDDDGYSQSDVRSEAATESVEGSVVVRGITASDDHHQENGHPGSADRPQTPDATRSQVADSALVLCPLPSDSGLGMEVFSPSSEKKPTVT